MRAARSLCLALLLLAACGSSSGRIPVDDALDNVPIDHPYVLATDAEHIWMTNRSGMTQRHELATYDRSTERWSVAELSWWKGEALDEIVAQPTDDGLAIVVGYCDGPCQRMRENLAGMAALFSPSPGQVERVDMRSPSRTFGAIRSIGADGPIAHFRTGDNRGHTLLVDVGRRHAAARTDGRDLDIVCDNQHGITLIERVPAGTAGAISEPAPPANFESTPPYVRSNWLVSSGPDLEHTRAVAVPEAAADAVAHIFLANGLACLPDGLAVVGPSDVWELHGTTWTRARAELGSWVVYEADTRVVELPDGALVAGARFERDPDGVWREHDYKEQVFRMGRTVIRYRFTNE